MKDTHYYIERKSPAAWLAVLFMLASAIIRTIYFWGKELTPIYLWIHFINVILAAFIFIITVVFLAKKLPQLSALSVLMGVIFFIIKSLGFESRLHTVLCIILYLAVLSLYSLTVFGIIKTKYLLYPLFGLPLIYHIFVEDMQLYILAKPTVPFFEWLPEISVLCIMTALLCVSFALKKR